MKTQMQSDDGSEVVNWSILALAGLLAVVWCSLRIYSSGERKTADFSNCVASIVGISGNTTSDHCTDANSTGHNYGYTIS